MLPTSHSDGVDGKNIEVIMRQTRRTDEDVLRKTPTANMYFVTVRRGGAQSLRGV